MMYNSFLSNGLVWVSLCYIPLVLKHSQIVSLQSNVFYILVEDWGSDECQLKTIRLMSEKSHFRTEGCFSTKNFPRIRLFYPVNLIVEVVV